ncbi:unnamed protein product [Spodoptera littoralis]|uniref:MADF domain-containing protein n=1 Tax=Spodoptera littoralis TaxID=7109 RepID=A0A9P0I366_SPOLI|nr:unnamed protein product [Spodoptera littoralis]CAH1638942.1 unnamed protein product [Spodoptera littoralis]
MMNSRHYRERLIDEVKKYPVLYDTQHENHRDIDVRDRCWLEISDRLGANSEVLKREWKILRDSMRQALKRSKTGATTKSGLPCKKWRFQSRMAFVLPYMTIRRNQRSVKSNIKVDDMEAGSEHEREAEAWEPSPQADSDHDSLDLFFASVCQSTKRLPRKLQSSVKRQVLDALLRVEEEWEVEQAESKTEVNKNF